MAEYPYTPKVSSLDPLFDRIQTTGVPSKVTIKYIESLGFKSKSDRYLPPLLKALGFLDSQAEPTERWKKYRNRKQAEAEMAQAIRETCAGLFDMYPDAHRKDAEALRNFFTSNTSVGEKAVQRNECAHPSNFYPGLNEALGYISELMQRIETLQAKTY